MFKAIPIILGMILTAQCQYTKDVIVQEYNNGLVSVVDDNGEKWQFFGDDFIPGQRIQVVFDNNSTSDPYDDAIVNVLR